VQDREILPEATVQHAFAGKTHVIFLDDWISNDITHINNRIKLMSGYKRKCSAHQQEKPKHENETV
jgi:hypothetical protein